MVMVSDVAKAKIPGGAMQQAQISSIQNSFTVVPEPGTDACLAAGFMAMCLLRRHKTSKQDS